MNPRVSSSLDATPAVVITGGAAGVGYAYADKFLSQSIPCVVCDVAPLDDAISSLKKKYPSMSEKVHGVKCDVSSAEDVDNLVEFAKDKLGTVTHWINNAGVNGGRRALTDVPDSQVELVVKVNLLGILLCSKKAIELMGSQPEGGRLFNTVGSGVKGGGTPGYASYGSTKRGLPQLTASLNDELTKGVQGYEKRKMKGEVKVYSLSPGMVFTKLLLEDSTPELRKFPFGVLAAQPEEVAEDLVPKILDPGPAGASIEFLGTDKILKKFFERFILQKKSEYIADDGSVIKLPGEEYDSEGVRKLY